LFLTPYLEYRPAREFKTLTGSEPPGSGLKAKKKATFQTKQHARRRCARLMPLMSNSIMARSNTAAVKKFR
jgi:hypothetical protein